MSAALAVSVSLLTASAASATNLFTSTITVDGTDTLTRGTDKAVEVLELFDNESLKAIFDGYTTGSAVSASVDFRGLPFSLGYDANSNVLTLVVPALDLTVDFDGIDREASQEMLEDFLTGKFDEVLEAAQTVGDLARGDATRVLQKVVALSPVDPVAGNPNSLQSRMFRADFDLGLTAPFQHPLGAKKPNEQFNLFEAGFEYGQFGVKDYTVQSAHLPFSWAYEFESNDNALIIDVPLTYTTAESGKSYMGSLGLGYRWRAQDWWTVTPVVRIGGVGSIDVGGLAALYSGSVTSHMSWHWNDATFGFGLMGGYSKTVDGVTIGGWDISYELANYVGQASIDVVSGLGFGMNGSTLGWRGYAMTSKFGGDELYVENSHEVGLELGTMGRNGKLLYQAMTVGLAYTFGDGYDGWTLRGRVRF